MAIEGGAFTCNSSEPKFTTEDVDEWNKHAKEHGHTMSGNTICRECGAYMRFEGYPYIPLEKDSGHLKDEVRLRCDNCDGKDWNPKGVKIETVGTVPQKQLAAANEDRREANE
jgi:hypothetical protein